MSAPLKICSLYSGSTGNSLFVASENAKILIDAGKSAKALCAALDGIGESISDIDAIFVTHEHIDHVSALNVISKHYRIPIHATKPCADALRGRCKMIEEVLIGHSPLFCETVGNISVSSFLTSHDSACPVGYKFTTDDGFSAGIMTDSGIVTNSAAEALTGCHTVVLESNHDRDMLKNGPYPYHLKERVASRFGHLSNELSARFAAYLAENGTESFLLAHLSAENNTPDLALESARRALADKHCTVRAAKPSVSVFAEMVY